MPLLRTFRLSSKPGDRHWIRPVINPLQKNISFIVQDSDVGVPNVGTVNNKNAKCLICRTTTQIDYIKEQARAGNLREQMTAIVVEHGGRRSFFPSNDEHIQVALGAQPQWRPQQRMTTTTNLVSGRGYGITHWHQLFTRRQLCVLTTFSELVSEVRNQILRRSGDEEYSTAVQVYLSMAISKTANKCSKHCRWRSSSQTQATEAFSRQAIPMVWDFAETNPLIPSSGIWDNQIETIASAVERANTQVNLGQAHQADAATDIRAEAGLVIVTDPPYYDNINYADLSDFYYVWLRSGLREILPNLFAGLSTPKSDELVADAQRFPASRQRFEELLNRALKLIRSQCSPEFPSSIFYAYKQQEEEREGRASTGWGIHVVCTCIRGVSNCGYMANQNRKSLEIECVRHKLVGIVSGTCMPAEACERIKRYTQGIS